MGFIRTNYNIPRGDPATSWIHNIFESTIRWDSVAVLSCAGYFFGSLGGYGLPSQMIFRPLSIPGPAASCKGDANDSTIQWHGLGAGSFSGSVYFVTALVFHAGSGAGITVSSLNAVDVYTASANPCSASGKIVYTAIFGSL